MALEYTCYRIAFLPRTAKPVSAFLGGAIRGTFGKLLRAHTCLTGAATCRDCLVARRCTYRALFDPLPPSTGVLEHGRTAPRRAPESGEPSALLPRTETPPGPPAQHLTAVPPPYVFDLGEDRGRVLAPGRPLELGLTLIGRAREHLQLCVLMLARAARSGLAKSRIELDLETVHALDRDGRWQLVLDREHGKLRPHPPSAWLDAPLALPSDAGARRLSLTLVSPCRLTQAGEVARPDSLKARTWLMSLVRRLTLLSMAHGDAPLALDLQDLTSRAAQAEITHRTLHWQRLPRWSSAQQREMPFDGLIGELVIEGPLAPFVPLVDFAVPLHVGKHANFGLGRFAHVWH